MRSLILLLLAALAPTLGHTTSRILVESEPGDIIGAGGTFDLQENLTASVWQNNIDIYTDTGWSFQFSAPDDETIKPGAYKNAIFWTTFDYRDAAISVSGPDTYCFDESGEFFIYELSSDTFSPIVAIDFVHYCGSSTAALRGTIRINSEVPHVNAGPLATADLAPALLIEGQTVQLDASNSFSQSGEIISYQWERLNGPAVSISNPNAIVSSIQVNDAIPLGGVNLEMQLTVTDASSLSDVFTFDLPVSSKSDPMSFLRFSSEEGDYIAQGENWFYDESNALFRMDSYQDNVVNISIDSDDYWSVDLASPEGSRLQEEFYDNATRFPFQDFGSAGFSISGDGRGCNESYGNFTVEKLVWEGEDPIEFRATFEQRCESRSAPLLTGEIAVNAYHESVPTASAGENFSIEEGSIANLNGSGSYDEIGTDIRYQWSTSDDNVTINSANQSRANFNAPTLNDRELSRNILVKLNIIDDEGYQANDSVQVTITAVNEPPYPADDAVTVARGGTITISPLINDIDDDGRILADSITLYEQPTEGTVVINSDGTIQYTHTADALVTDQIHYSVEDNDGDISLPATITVTISEEQVVSDPVTDPVVDPEPDEGTGNEPESDEDGEPDTGGDEGAVEVPSDDGLNTPSGGSSGGGSVNPFSLAFIIVVAGFVRRRISKF